MALQQSRDTIGRTSQMNWALAGQTIASDFVAYSQSGRIITQSINGIIPNPNGDEFVYDASGRLVTAFVPGQRNTYGYGSTTGCPMDNAGKNGNRTTSAVHAVDPFTGAVGALLDSDTYCYDSADKLTGTTAIASGAITYDTHGNTTEMGGQTFAYDAADRHLATTSGDTTVVYKRDTSDRIVSRSTTNTSFRGSSSAAVTSASAIALTKPTNVGAGDTLVATITVSGGNSWTMSQTNLQGWTFRGVRDSGATVKTIVFTKTATALEPNQWSWAFDTNRHAAGVVAAYTGVANVDVVDSIANSAGTTHTTPAATATRHGSRVITAVGIAGATSFAPAPAFAERADTATAAQNDNASITLGDASQASKKVDAKSLSSNAPGASVGFSIVLQPADPTVSATTKYAFADASDSPVATYDGDDVTPAERSIGLAGGVTKTVRADNSQTWSYPNIHGDVMMTTDAAGADKKLFYYDPFGNPLTGSTSQTIPENSRGDMDYGWLGSHERPYEHGAGISIIEMGARQYSPVLGRFLEVDPIEGGSCNDYEYTCGDPANKLDLDGRRTFGQQLQWYTSLAGFCVLSKTKCAAAFRYGRIALAEATRRFKNGTREQDAFRHMYWHALMVHAGLGFEWGQAFGRAYEAYPNNADGPGDIVNNRLGAIIGRRVRRAGFDGLWFLADTVAAAVWSGGANTSTNCASCSQSAPPGGWV